MTDPLTATIQEGHSLPSFATMKFLGNIGESLRVDDEVDWNSEEPSKETDDFALSELSPVTDVSQTVVE